MISKEDKQMLLSLKKEDVTFNKLLELMGTRSKRVNGKVVVIPSKFEPMDEFYLEKGEYFNKERVLTTVGRFIFNKIIIENDFEEVLGYINQTMTGSDLTKMENKLSEAYLEDRITEEQMVRYLNNIQKLLMNFHVVISSSFSMKTLKPIDKVTKKKEELLDKYGEQIKNGDVAKGVEIEKELLDLAAKETKGDHGMYLFKSGARGSFGNNYKNTSVVRGPVFNPNTGKFDFISSNFMEGIKKEELSAYGTSIITGSYSKAIGTADSGYLTKQLLAALQTVVLDKRGSDCGSTHYTKIKITKFNAGLLDYRYFKEGNKLVMFTRNNASKYIGKELEFRTPKFCKNKKICNKCAGDLLYLLGIKNIGLTSSKVSSRLLNLNMKKFHDATVKISVLDPNDIIL